MLIEQIIKFELRGPGPLGSTFTPNNWLISWQNKNLYGKSSSGLLFTAKILQEANHLNSLLGPNHSQLKFNIKIQDFKVFWT